MNSTFYTRAELYSIAKTNGPAAPAAFLGEIKFKNEKDNVAQQRIVDRFLSDIIIYRLQKIEAVNDARRKMEEARKRQRRLRNARVRTRTAIALKCILDVNGRKLLRTAIKDESLGKYLTFTTRNSHKLPEDKKKKRDLKLIDIMADWLGENELRDGEEWDSDA